MAERIIRAFEGYNIAAPGVSTNIITTSITPARGVYALRVTVALTVSSVFNVAATDGTTAHAWGLNASAALNAADLYSFEFSVHADPDSSSVTYNFQVESDGVVECLLVDQLKSE